MEAYHVRVFQFQIEGNAANSECKPRCNRQQPLDIAPSHTYAMRNA
jgi:hypothetical protein